MMIDGVDCLLDVCMSAASSLITHLCPCIAQLGSQSSH